MRSKTSCKRPATPLIRTRWASLPSGSSAIRSTPGRASLCRLSSMPVHGERISRNTVSRAGGGGDACSRRAAGRDASLSAEMTCCRCWRSWSRQSSACRHTTMPKTENPVHIRLGRRVPAKFKFRRVTYRTPTSTKARRSSSPGAMQQGRNTSPASASISADAKVKLVFAASKWPTILRYGRVVRSRITPRS